VSYQFPAVNNTDVSSKSGDLILGGSIGINKILLYFRENAHKARRKEWDLFFVNVYTLGRNCFRSGMKLDEFVFGIDNEIEKLTTYYSAYTQARETRKVGLIFYIPDYEHIPRYLRLEKTGQKKEFDELYRELLKAHKKTKYVDLTEDENIQRFLINVQDAVYPHKALPLITGKKFGNVGTLLLSHVAMDYHLYKSYKNINVIESHQGNILEYQDFGKKLIKDVRVPFNTITHRVFGDSTVLKPLLEKKDKKKLLENIKTKNWFIRTDYELKKFILETTSIKETDLDFLKL